MSSDEYDTDGEFDNVVEGLGVLDVTPVVDTSPQVNLPSGGSVVSDDSGNPIEEAQVVTINAPPPANFYNFVSIFMVTSVYSVIMSFHTFRTACTSQEVLKVYKDYTMKRIVNISANSNVFLEFMLALYDQFRQNALQYIVREFDPVMGPATLERYKARFDAFRDFVFKKNHITAGNTYQCLVRNFRNHILIPVIMDKYNIQNPVRLPTAFGGDVDFQTGYMMHKATPADVEYLPMGN